MYNYATSFAFVLCLFSFLFLFFYSFRTKNGTPTKWPVVGMLPAILKNHNRLHDYIVEVMEKTQSTYFVKGPWFTTMNLLVTVDPTNVQYILSQNFKNYPKGPKFQEIFEVLGDSIINADSDMWKYHRKMATSVFAHPQFNKFLVKKTWEMINTGLIPILDHVSNHKLEIDFQDLSRKFAFDIISKVLMDYDPRSLRIDLPQLPFSKALHDIEDWIVYRHWMPACVWKFQRWLGVGQERKYKEAWKVIDDFVYGCISRKRQEIHKSSQSCKADKVEDQLGIDLMTLYMHEVKENTEFVASKGDKFLRDTILGFFAAGQDSLGAAITWFLYLLSMNPHVLSKIRQELDATIARFKHDDHGDVINIMATNFDELKDKLIYLHAAMLEALRLYPSVPFNSKAPAEVDTLPSGHRVDPNNTQIIISMYAMGRMKSIWGEDCNEFKPERWILETGEFKYVPSHKFMTFNTGPRTCIGRNVSLIVIKAVVMAIISKYRIEPIEGHPIVPSVSVILYMKHGFKVKVASC